MPLKEYIRKRDFDRTREPRGRVESKSGRHRFVIQKHAASRLHYDFRLEIDGVLKSWAVPKGVPFQKGDKRLAVAVEDHPVSYIDFEGTIPKGQYGGGTVMVWDFGTFEAEGDSVEKDLAGGKLHFRLHGKKLNGEWHLVRMREGEQWLLIKGGEDAAPISTRMDDTSALSGKSMAQLAGGGGSVWESKPSRISEPENGKKAVKPIKARKSKRSAALKFVEPMKARLVEAAPTGQWIYEIKFDGFRALAIKNGDETTLFSRNEKDLGAKFPEVARAVEGLGADSALIDGEIVALDDDGRSSFQLLQAYDLGEKRPPIFYYAFDLLNLNGRDLMGERLEVRKAELEKLLGKQSGVVRFSSSLEGDVRRLLEEAKRMGLEGLIGKRVDSVYEPGRRSGAWVKLKLHQEQEMVIGGYTDPTGSRQHFGALLVGYYRGEALYFAGKVGTGYTEAVLAAVNRKMQGLRQDECPFVNLPDKRGSSRGITRPEMKRCHWVKPTLVCQIKFSEWTRDKIMRQPVFLGLRDDKSAREVVMEKAGGQG